MVEILWSRLGSPLPPDFPKRRDGSPYPSGTAYELLNAIDHRRAKVDPPPDILIYQKLADTPSAGPGELDKQRARLAALELLDAFVREYFINETDGWMGAIRSFETLTEFEALFEDNLIAWLGKNRVLGRSRRWRVEQKGSPFCGLRPFDGRHREVFFGRDADVERARERLDAHDFLVIEGASGAGKSSLALAGLLPRLTDIDPDLRTVVVQPETGAPKAPLLALAAALREALPELAQGDYPDGPSLATHLAWAADVAPVRRALERAQEARAAQGDDRPVGLVLLVDQFERLFAESTPTSIRECYGKILAGLVATRGVRVVVTLRADALGDALAVPPLADLIDRRGRLSLAPPQSAALREIVCGPAEAAALAFERDSAGIGLDEVLIADVTADSALPLLQFALDELYRRALERHDALGGDLGDVGEDTPVLTLRHSDYAEMGFLAGAIGHEAERALRALSPAAQDRLPRLVRALIDTTGGATLLRRAPVAETHADPAMAELSRALIDARILVREADSVTLAHQRVLSAWPSAAAALEEAESFARVRGELTRAEARWRDNGRRRDLLLPSGLRLAEAEDMVRRYGEEFDPVLHAYVGLSGRRARTQQRLTVAAAFLFFGLAVAAGWFAFDADHQRVIAEANATEAERQRGFAADNETRAVANATEAERQRGLAEAAALRAEANAGRAAAAAVEAGQKSATRGGNPGVGSEIHRAGPGRGRTRPGGAQLRHGADRGRCADLRHRAGTRATSGDASSSP